MDIPAFLRTRTLGFNGELAETDTGWQLLGNGYRAYNPVLMHFHSPDSLSPFGEGGLNAYMYCGGDPVNRTDPSGHVGVAKRILSKTGIRASPGASRISSPAPGPAVMTKDIHPIAMPIAGMSAAGVPKKTGPLVPGPHSGAYAKAQFALLNEARGAGGAAGIESGRAGAVLQSKAQKLFETRMAARPKNVESNAFIKKMLSNSRNIKTQLIMKVDVLQGRLPSASDKWVAERLKDKIDTYQKRIREL